MKTITEENRIYERVLLISDLEGIYDVYDLDNLQDCKKKYIKEVEIYIETLLTNRVKRIDVCDIHNQGNLLTDLSTKYKAVDVISTTKNVDFSVKYDFAILVGFHGMAGSNGILPHTLRFDFKQVCLYSDRFERLIPIGEVEIYIRWLGFWAVPVIVVAGDREAVYEANCFNPNRVTICTKSIFESYSLSRNRLQGMIESSISSAIQLGDEYCLAEDNERLFISFYNEDVLDELKHKGYNVENDYLTFDSCSAFVEDLYSLVEHLKMIDQETLIKNAKLIAEIRAKKDTLCKEKILESEIGSILNQRTIYSLRRSERKKIRETLNI